METTLKETSLLYIGEESACRKNMADLLSDEIKKLIIVSNAESGYKKYIELEPEIIISDLNLSNSTSHEMIKKIDNKIPIIITVSNDDTQQLKKAVDLGVKYYLLKPIQEIKLFEILHKITQTSKNKNRVIKQNKPANNSEKDTPQTNQDLLLESQRISHIGSWSFNPTSQEIYWSEELYRIFELDSKECTPSYELLLSLIQPQDRQEVDAAQKELLNNNIAYNIEYTLDLQDGQTKFVNERSEAILDNNNQVSVFMGTIQDISERKKIDDALKSSEEIMIQQSRYAAMGEMISMIAHQWRQPITTISMCANNLIVDIELDSLETSDVKKSALTITEQTQYLSKTIDDFRAFFKKVKQVETGTMKELFEETSKIMMTSLKNNEIDFKLEFDESLTITTYIRELLQVLINIIKNAKDALVENQPKNKFIKISVTEIDENVEILISDNAGGIKKEIIDKIFDAYFTTKDDQTGTGLGLYMSKTIVEKHLKGSLNVKNIKEGVEFTVLLPTQIEESEN